MSRTAYPYAQGDRLEERNTYFYAPYGGMAFLSAWEKNRLNACHACEPPPQTEASAITGNEPASREMAEWLACWRSGKRLSSRQNARFLGRLRHFEVSKRLFPAYDNEGKPLDRSDYRCVPRYIEFALVLEAAYAARQDLRYLNALLKVNDTLLSLSAQATFRHELSWLLEQECRHVKALAEHVGVTP